jgi:hypothetical protein
MEHIIQRLQIEAHKAQLALFQLGRDYLAGKCESVHEMSAETIALMKLSERVRTESGVLQAESNLVQGRIKPVWG